MILLLPSSREEWTLRRLPWITFGLMALCTLATLALVVEAPAGETHARKLDGLRTYYFEHPYLELDKSSEEIVFEGMDAERRADFRATLKPAGPTPDVKQLKSEQLELERRERAVVAALEDDPLSRWGLVPARRDPITFLTSLFMHAGWIHLLGNLLILYLVGPFVEDVWGRPLYLLLYLASGLVASAAWVYTRPSSPVALVGASGAISGLVGAFLMRYGRTNVSFFYWIFFARGTFGVPAWIFLPLWFIEQLYFSSISPPEAGGVAFALHAAGFASGVVAALLYHFTGLETRYVVPRIATKVSAKASVPVASRPAIQPAPRPALERAAEAKKSGEKSRAMRIIKEEASRRPQDKDVLLSLWDSAMDAGRPEKAVDALEQVIRLDLKENDPGLAAEHWLELEAYAPHARLGASAFLKIGQALRASGHREEAGRALRRALEAAGTMPEPMIAFTIARAALGVDQELARTAARLSLAIPGLEPRDRDVARRLAGVDDQEPPQNLPR